MRIQIEHRLVRINPFDGGVLAAVVPAGQIEIVEDLHAEGVGVAAADADRARGVQLADGRAEEAAARAGHARIGGVARLGRRDLVADRPDEDRGMVAVAPHELAQVARDIRLEVLRLAAAGGPVPFVETFVPDENPHLVAEVEHFGRRAVVAGAQGVEAHVAQDFELAAHGRAVERHAQRPEIGVQIDAVELYAAAVEVEAVVGREGEGADAEARGLGVGGRARLNADARLVKVRLSQIPQARACEREGVRQRHGRAGRHVEREGLFGGAPAAGRQQRDGDRGLHRLRGGVGDGRFDPHDGLRGAGLWRRDEGGFVRDVDGVATRQRDLAVDAGAGIPARMVLARVGPHGHGVGAAEGDKGRGVHAETQVAVIPAAGAPPVDEDLRTGHDAVEIEVDAPAGVVGGGREDGAVPADAAPGQLARAAVGVGTERPGDRPVVRDAHRLPGAVIEGGGRSVERGVGVALETPAGIEEIGRALGAEHRSTEREPC